MNKQEAIEYIQEWLKDKYALNGKDRVVLNMAIEALQFQDIMINNPKTAKPTPEVCKNCTDKGGDTE